METINQFLTSNGISENDLVLDGTFKELKTQSGFKGWYVGDNLGPGKRSITIEDWRTRDRKTFIEGVDLTDPEEQKKLAEIRSRYEKEKKDLQLLKQEIAQEKIKEFSKENWVTPSKYLVNKKIDQTFGAILVESRIETTDLIIPMYDKSAVLWNYQTIQDSGAKAFVPGALVDGLFFRLRDNVNVKNDEIIICEGFATACSIKISYPEAVVFCAFSAGNLQLVAELVRVLYPTSKILIAGDDDVGKQINTGRDKAEAAAKSINGAAFFPSFS